MGVPGPKLLDDEQLTQDMFGVSTPTFVTPDTRANAQLQHWSLQERVAVLLHRTRATRTSSTRSCSCSGRRRSRARSRASTSAASRTCSAKARRCSTRSPRAGRSGRACRGCRCRPPDNYLRDAMVETLAEEDVEFDIRLQVQTDPFLMPIENNARAVADEAVAARAGRRAPDPEADVRLARAARLRARAHLQPVALDRRAPPARQPEPGAKAHVLRAVAATPADERASSTTSRRATRSSRLARRSRRGSAAPRGRAGRSRRRP